MNHALKKAVQDGDITKFNIIFTNKDLNKLTLIQSITLNDLEQLKHNEANPRWENAGTGGGTTLPPSNDRYIYQWSDDGKYIVRYECRPQPGTYDKMLNLIIQKRVTLGLSPNLEQSRYKTPSPNDVTELYQTCKKGDFIRAKEIIETKSVDPNIIISNFMSSEEGPMLKFAAESGNLDLVKYLCEDHHVDIEAKGILPGMQDTALSQACTKGHYEIAVYLLSQGANPNSKITYGSVLANAIYSKNLQLVQLLVANGAEIKAKEIDNALEKGVFEISEFLLDKSTNLQNSYIAPFVQVAAKGGCVKTLQLLTGKYKMDLFATKSHIEQNKPQGHGILSSAAKGGSVTMMKFLVEECELDVVSMVKIENEKEINYQYNANDTILGNALKSNSLLLVRYLFCELNLLPPNKAIKYLKEQLNCYLEVEVIAYLESYLTDAPDIKSLLLKVALDGLDSLDLPQLLVLFQSNLPSKVGSALSVQIKEKILAVSQFDVLVQQYPPKVAQDLLLYFSSSSNNINWLPQMNVLLNSGVAINFTNESQENLLHVTIAARSFSPIVTSLIEHGVSADHPNHKGVTAINILGGMLDIEVKQIAEVVALSAEYTNSLKQSVKVERDKSLRVILSYSKGAIGKATVNELIESALNVRGKLKELLCYVSEPIYNEMKSLLTGPDFVSSYKEKNQIIIDSLKESKIFREKITISSSNDIPQAQNLAHHLRYLGFFPPNLDGDQPREAERVFVLGNN